LPPALPPSDRTPQGNLPCPRSTLEHILLTVGIYPSVPSQSNDNDRARQQNDAEEDYRYHYELPIAVMINPARITFDSPLPSIRRLFLRQVGQRQT
jgi:hypothetical protein